jgi:hypothetical protein
MALTALVNRSNFNSELVQNKLHGEAWLQCSIAMTCILREVHWIKKHLGALRLHERATGGFAQWSFEDAASRKPIKRVAESAVLAEAKEGRQETNMGHRQSEPPPMLAPLTREEDADELQSAVNRRTDGNNTDDDKTLVSNSLLNADKEIIDPSCTFSPIRNAGPHKAASPPRGVPLLQLSAVSPVKRVYTSGGATSQGDELSNVAAAPVRAPVGAVPLFAMGHNPALDEMNFDAERESALDFYYSMGPYSHRLRPRVPPLGIMKQIDAFNKKRFSAAIAAKGVIASNRGAQAIKSPVLMPGVKGSSGLSYAGTASTTAKASGGVTAAQVPHDVPRSIPTAATAAKAAARRGEDLHEKTLAEEDLSSDSGGSKDGDNSKSRRRKGRQRGPRREQNSIERGAIGIGRGRPMPQQETVLSWLMSSFSKKDDRENIDNSVFFAAANPPPPVTVEKRKRFFPFWGGGSSSKPDVGIHNHYSLGADQLMSDMLGMWCSPASYQALLVISRDSRLQTVLRAAQMQVSCCTQTVRRQLMGELFIIPFFVCRRWKESALMHSYLA